MQQANSRPLAAALAGWDASGHGSLAQRLAVGLRRLIDAGVLAGGARLPPERQLARSLAVSRSTVTAALDVLRGDGVVSSQQGSGTVVAGVPAAELATNRVADGFVFASGGIDLAVGNPADVAHLPPVSVDIADLLTSGAGFHPLGLPALRQALAQHHCDRGVYTEIDQIHVTAGAHQAISLTIGTLAGPGDTVAVESPNYPGIFDIIDLAGARAVAIESDGAGPLPESLDHVLRDERPAVVYLQAGPQNPTGVVTSAARVRALAEVLDRHDTPLIEDATLDELVFAGRPENTLARLCRHTPIISVGSFSKVFWGGLRVGWLRAAPPFVDRTLYRRLAGDLGTSAPAQLLCLALLPRLAEIAARRREYLAGNVARALDQLADELPELEAVAPGGGSVVWGALPADDTGPLVQFALRHGVHIAAGSMSVIGQRGDPHVRICVDRPPELVEIGLARLGAAWRELRRRPSRVAG